MYIHYYFNNYYYLKKLLLLLLLLLILLLLLSLLLLLLLLLLFHNLNYKNWLAMRAWSYWCAYLLRQASFRSCYFLIYLTFRWNRRSTLLCVTKVIFKIRLPSVPSCPSDCLWSQVYTENWSAACWFWSSPAWPLFLQLFSMDLENPDAQILLSACNSFSIGLLPKNQKKTQDILL